MDQLGFCHVSDCHFGPIPANYVYPAVSGLTGQPAHDVGLCKGLSLALEDARDLVEDLPEDESFAIVLSGDLTACGAETEYAVGHSFFRSRWRLRREDPSPVETEVGLGLSPANYANVPGNHDHWLGKSWFKSPGFNARLVPRHFRQSPWCKTWRSLHGGVCLELYGLDSNAAVRGQNHLARGRIEATHLQALERKLKARSKPRDPLRVRAVVVHHSLAYTSGLFHAKKLDPTSRDELRRICAENECVAILTGHTHDFYHHPAPVTLPTGQRTVHELRCATTLQGPPKSGKQGFLFHRIELEQGHCQWVTWKYVWTSGGYVRRYHPDWRFQVV